MYPGEMRGGVFCTVKRDNQPAGVPADLHPPSFLFRPQQFLEVGKGVVGGHRTFFGR